MTEILLLGTFHFMESSIDFYSPKSQEELHILSNKLQRFDPDTIAVEAAIHAQKYVDNSYDKFRLEDLNDSEKMKRETLGDIYIFGDYYPIKYNNEAVQIGYRLGKMLSHTQIYAIDDDTILNTDLLGSVAHKTEPRTRAESLLSEAQNEYYVHLSAEPKDAIIDRLKYYNDDKWINLNHNIYIKANAIDAGENYKGANMVADWYKRNLKIFANIQKLATDSKRMFIIYGAGHLKILKQLIESDKNLKLVDIYEYI